MKDFTGKLELIDPRKVVIDHRYQRPEKDALIAAIAAEPRWELFGTLVVFRRGDAELYYCVDGQQRLRGVVSSDEPPKRVPAVVFTVSEIEDEAGVFVRINEFRKQLTAVEKHQGKKVAKDPAALAIERAVDETGFSISASSDSTRAIGSPASLYYAYNLLGEDGVSQLLIVVREAWPNDRKATASKMIRALADIIDEQKSNGGFSRTALSKKLARTTPGALSRKAEEIHFEMGKSKRDSLRAAFKVVARV